MNGTPRWTERSEGVHSLGWEGSRGRELVEIGIVVGEYQWVVGY
jgi:hypothetical protein